LAGILANNANCIEQIVRRGVAAEFVEVDAATAPVPSTAGRKAKATV